MSLRGLRGTCSSDQFCFPDVMSLPVSRSVADWLIPTVLTIPSPSFVLLRDSAVECSIRELTTRSGSDNRKGVLEAHKSAYTQVEAHVQQHRLTGIIKSIVYLRTLIDQPLLTVDYISLQHGISFFQSMPRSSRLRPTPIVQLPAVQRYGFSRRPSCLTSCSLMRSSSLASIVSPWFQM